MTAVDDGDVGVAQRRKDVGFSLEPGKAIRSPQTRGARRTSRAPHALFPSRPFYCRFS